MWGVQSGEPWGQQENDLGKTTYYPLPLPSPLLYIHSTTTPTPYNKGNGAKGFQKVTLLMSVKRTGSIETALFWEILLQ